MAAAGNGRAKKPKKNTPSANGHMNSHLNGHADKAKAKASGPVVPSSKKTQRKPSISGSLISIFSRLTVWYLIATLLFRCPSSISELSDESPRVCKPYLQVRSHAAPYLDPYYQAYLAPQVDKVKPYVHRLDEQLYTPLSTFAKDKYTTYGAHRVEHARKVVEAEWARTVQPQLQNIQAKARDQYDQHLEPYVQKALSVLSPYYDQIKDSLVEIYHLSILPTYEAILPYARQGYAQGHHVTTHIIFPTVRSAQATTWKFISRTLWPKVRVLYGDNVEPQLVRIQARLGRYKDQQKLESAVDSMSSETSAVSEKAETSSTLTSSTTSSSTVAATSTGSSSDWSILDDLIGSDAPGNSADVETKNPTPSKRPQPTGEALRESLNEDLRNWQSKFATAADKGAEDLESRVAEITERQVEKGVNGHGAALIVQLEETAESSVTAFKAFIKKTVESIPEDPTEEDLEIAYEKCVAKTRELGLSIKERAQAVRNWKSAYDQETDELVRAAVSSTVEVLERIHSLGLQEVGMRWAWLDGVTYNDWQRYHKLRNTLTEWQAEVEAVGSRHEGLKIAHDEAAKLEDSAISTASAKVSELVRLKEVAKWKIWAEDASDDFSDKKVPTRAFKAAQQVIGNAQVASSKASEAIVGSETPTTESIASAIQQSMSDASSTLSEAIMGSETPATESLASAVKSQASQASSEMIEAGEAAASEGPKKVFGGAMAQAVPEAKQAVFDQPLDDDDEETYSERISSMLAKAGDRASDLSRAVSEALLGAPKTQGTVGSVSSLASEQYSKALAAASSVLYGTEQPAMASATSVAHEKFAQAVTAASYAIYGTPAPTAVYKIVQVQASSRYSDAISLANEQYTNAKSQLSALISGTPKPAHETMLSMIEKAYSDSLEAAGDKLNAALQYTDSAKSYMAGPTQKYFESVSSIASSRLAEGLSLASEHLISQPTPALDGARQRYYEAVGLAHERNSKFLKAASSAVYGPEQGSLEWLASVASADSVRSIYSRASTAAESAASQVSSGVMGTETPWTESVASRASENWDDLISKASLQIYGQPTMTPWSGALYSQAGAYAAQATAQAAEQYSAVQALISELVVGKEPDFTDSVMSRFSSAYYTGIPAVVSSVNSVASENFEAVGSYAADAYTSASSVATYIFTPPPAIETILSQASEQLNLAVESASAAVYGTPKGTVEQASESIASAYSSVQSQASAAIYGTQQAQDSFLAVANSAQAAISEAIFGTPTATGYAASITSGAGSVYSSVASVASVKAANAASAVSSAIYGPEQGAVESASSRLAAAVEAANSQISQLYAVASKSAEDAASLVGSAATGATQRVKDEL